MYARHLFFKGAAALDAEWRVQLSLFTFSVLDSSRPIASNVIDLPDAANALTEAIRYTGRVLGSAPDLLLVDGDWTIEVTDRLGLVLLNVLVSAIRSPSLKGH